MDKTDFQTLKEQLKEFEESIVSIPAEEPEAARRRLWKEEVIRKY